MRRIITTLAFVAASTACTYKHFDPPPTTTPGGAPYYSSGGVFSDGWIKYDNSSPEQFEKDFKKCKDEANAPDADGVVKYDSRAFEQCMRKLGYSKEQ